MAKQAKEPSSLKKITKKMALQNLIFQQDDASVLNTMIVIKFFKEEEMEVLKR